MISTLKMCYISPRVPRMFYLSLLFMLQLVASDEVTPRMFDALNQTTQVIKEVYRRETRTLPPPYLHLPVFLESRLPLVEKEHFSPARGTGLETLPEPVREILLPVRRPTNRPPSDSGLSVRTSCKLNKMHVQVSKAILGAGDASSRLKVGTCHPSKTTNDYLYFEYDIGMCGTKRTVINNRVTYLNTLQYDPPRLQGLIRRTVGFKLPVACYYNRYQYSYKIGYTPELRMRKIFKPMRSQAKFLLTPRNAQWEWLSSSEEYVLGEPMYFEAQTASLSQDERLYVHSCYATPERSHTSKPQFPVVINFGCMVESKDGHSRFIPYKNNAVRFSVDAFLFKGMTGQQLYMHCNMSVDSSVPSPTAKSCNYDTDLERWVELYGSDSVCTCCDSNCNSDSSTVTEIISTRAWSVEPKEKPSTTQKRKKVSILTSPASPLELTTELTEWAKVSQPEAIAVTQMGKGEKKLEWPFRAGSVKWDGIEDEDRQVMGSAVVEKQAVTQPHRIFEEIFGFDE